MELTDLVYFRNVADSLSFKEGARRSHVSSPAISKTIAKLEQELGTKLLARTTRQVRLTPSGEVLLSGSRRVIEEIEAIRREIDQVESVVRGALKIGALEVYSLYLLPLAIARIVERHPELTPKSYEMIPDQIERRVASGDLDVGLSIGSAPVGPLLERVRLGTSPGLVVCGRSHPLFARGRIDEKALQQHAFVIPEFLGQEHLPVLDQFPDARHPRRIGATIELLQMGVQLTLSGKYIGCFPEISVRSHVAAGTLRALKGLAPWAPFELYAVVRKGIRPKPAVPILIDTIKAGLTAPRARASRRK